MSVLEITIPRLINQQLARSRFKQAGELLSWLGPIQGQDYAGAKWSLGLRLPGSTEAKIEQAIAEGVIARSWLLRGTLHFVAAEDLRWLTELLAWGLLKSNARRYGELELDTATLVRSSDLLSQALRAGAHLTRTELFAMLEQHDISTAGQRGVYMLQRAALDGLIYQSVMRGRDTTFLALEGLPGPAKTLARDEALAELARRYFTSRGPATLADFVWWSGLAVKEAKAGLDAVQKEFDQETMAGQTYWLAQSETQVKKSSTTLYLLPGFDEYLLAYKDRSAALDVPRYKRLTPTNGMLPPTMVFNGRVIGTWKRTFKKDTVTVLPEPFESLSPEESVALDEAAEIYGQFLGMKVQVEKSDK